MRSTRVAKRIASALLGIMLFAQAALAVAACDRLLVAPAQALMAKEGEPSCHEEPRGNTNLCLAHCLRADQISDTPQFVIPPWPQATLRVVRVPEFFTVHVPALRFMLPPPSAPPRILFQTFLI